MVREEGLELVVVNSPNSLLGVEPRGREGLEEEVAEVGEGGESSAGTLSSLPVCSDGIVGGSEGVGFTSKKKKFKKYRRIHSCGEKSGVGRKLGPQKRGIEELGEAIGNGSVKKLKQNIEEHFGISEPTVGGAEHPRRY